MHPNEVALQLMLKILDRSTPNYASPDLTGKNGENEYYDSEKVARSYRKMVEIIESDPLPDDQP